MDNCRLFVGGIPKTKKKDEIMEEMKKVTEGVVDVIVYPSAADKTKPGFHQVTHMLEWHMFSMITAKFVFLPIFDANMNFKNPTECLLSILMQKK